MITLKCDEDIRDSIRVGSRKGRLYLQQQTHYLGTCRSRCPEVILKKKDIPRLIKLLEESLK